MYFFIIQMRISSLLREGNLIFVTPRFIFLWHNYCHYLCEVIINRIIC